MVKYSEVHKKGFNLQFHNHPECPPKITMAAKNEYRRHILETWKKIYPVTNLIADFTPTKCDFNLLIPLHDDFQ